MTEEQVDSSLGSEAWDDDIFNRKKYADFLTALICAKSASFLLNIDAAWGAGKTFFITR